MIKAIDFARLYREHMARSGRAFKTPAHWDAQATRVRNTVMDSEYRIGFFGRMQFTVRKKMKSVR